VFHSFRVHTNAIIDMVFTDDDRFLATASGDQSARIVDMNTQTTISILGNHTASLKQVRFQPGANNHSVIATSSRDGSIQIWDLRVNGYSGEWICLSRIPPHDRVMHMMQRCGPPNISSSRFVISVFHINLLTVSRPTSSNVHICGI